MLYLANRNRVHSPETERALQASQGYLFLNMSREAAEELRDIPPNEQKDPDVLLARTRVLLHERHWKAAELLSAEGCAQYPEVDEFTVQRAFSLHQMQQGEKAVQVLLSAPEWLRRTGILHYNLACYEARLGDLSMARRCMNAAFQINSEVKKNARNDPDLQGLWN
jgi:hypothetical protein